MRGPAKRPEDFTRFYYSKVALGEGCGCAERVIDNHELTRLATAKPAGRVPRGGGFGKWLRGLLRRG